MSKYIDSLEEFTELGEIYPLREAGQYLIHQRVPGQRSQLYILRPAAASDERFMLLSDPEHNVTQSGATDDGNVAFYIAQQPDEKARLYRVPCDGSAPPELVRGSDGKPIGGRPAGRLRVGARTIVVGFQDSESDAGEDIQFYELSRDSGAMARPFLRRVPIAHVQHVSESAGTRMAVISQNNGVGDPWRGSCQVIDLDKGEEIGAATPPARDLHPAHRMATISPDGQELLYQRQDGDWLRLYVRDVSDSRGELLDTELNDEAGDLVGGWHPSDPNKVLITRFHGNHASVYSYDRKSKTHTRVVLPDGFNPHQLYHGDGEYSQPRFAPDGKVTVLASSPVEGPYYFIADPGNAEVPTVVEPLSGVRPPGPARREEVLVVPWVDDEPSPEHNLGVLNIEVRIITPTRWEKPESGWRVIFLDRKGGPHLPDLADRNLLEDIFLERGFALMVPGYDGREGYGTRHRNALLKDPGRAEARCFDAVIDHIQEQRPGFIDPKRVGFHGWSWGGFIGALLAEHSTKFRAVVAGTPIVDTAAGHELTTSSMRRVIEHRFGGSPHERPEAYARASAVACLPPQDAPLRDQLKYREQAPDASILFIPGEQDVRCPDTTKEYCDRLNQLGRDAERHVMPGGHFNGDLRQRRLIVEKTMAFFDKHLPSPEEAGSSKRVLPRLSLGRERRGQARGHKTRR